MELAADVEYTGMIYILPTRRQSIGKELPPCWQDIATSLARCCQHAGKILPMGWQNSGDSLDKSDQPTGQRCIKNTMDSMYDISCLRVACLRSALFKICPVYKVPVDEVPVYKVPVDEAPVYKVPADEAPADEAPADEAPADEAPVDETPVDEVPVDETPVYNLSCVQCICSAVGTTNSNPGQRLFRFCYRYGFTALALGYEPRMKVSATGTIERK